jgi:AbiV family abortive infection protein
LCTANALRLWRDARIMARARRVQGFRILSSFACEEAAKALILMDAARCPRQPADVFNRQLGYFTDHLAKGIYAEYYQWRFRYLDNADRWFSDALRKEYDLDGPNGTDWIVRNEIVQLREDTIYVDYVSRDEGKYWHEPRPLPLDPPWFRRRPPKVIGVCLALHHSGMTSTEALREIAGFWRILDPRGIKDFASFRKANVDLLQSPGLNCLLRHRSRATYREVCSGWLLPLHGLDLGKIRVNLEDLRALQRTAAERDTD